MTCPKDGGAEDETASVQTQERVKLKQDSPPMMSRRIVTTCPKDGGAGNKKGSVQTQEKVKEKQELPPMMNGRMMTTCPTDGGAGEETCRIPEAVGREKMYAPQLTGKVHKIPKPLWVQEEKNQL